MSSDSAGDDGVGSQAVATPIELLRAEVAELHNETTPDPLPAEIENVRGLLALAQTDNLDPLVLGAVDELMASDRPVAETTRTSLTPLVDAVLGNHRRASGLLEPILRSGRQSKGMSVKEVADQLSLPEVTVSEIEAGQMRFDEVDGRETKIAAWIALLADDHGEAVEALRRSMVSVPREYRGAMEPISSTEDFVQRVADLLAAEQP